MFRYTKRKVTPVSAPLLSPGNPHLRCRVRRQPMIVGLVLRLRIPRKPRRMLTQDSPTDVKL